MKVLFFAVIAFFIISCDEENNMVTVPDETSQKPEFVGVGWVLSEFEYEEIDTNRSWREIVRFENENNLKTYIRYYNYENSEEDIRDSLFGLIDYGSWELIEDRIELYSAINDQNVLTGLNTKANFTILNLNETTFEVDHYSYWGWGWGPEYYEGSPYEDIWARKRTYIRR